MDANKLDVKMKDEGMERVAGKEGAQGIGAGWLTLQAVMPYLILGAIAIVALVMGGADAKDVALAATSGLAGIVTGRVMGR